jgi:hypothetical protein
VKIASCDIVGYPHLKIESSYMTRVRDIDMVREIRLSLTAKSIPRLIQQLVIRKICKKKDASYFFATSSVGGGVVLLFCDPCFETLNVLYKREIRQRVEEGTIFEDEVED